MAVESAADLAAYFADFGGAATWTHDGTDVTVTGIFENAARSFEGGSQVAAVRAAASFTCAASSLPEGAGQGDELEVDGNAYLVRAFMPDGTGVVTAELEAVR